MDLIFIYGKGNVRVHTWYVKTFEVLFYVTRNWITKEMSDTSTPPTHP